MQFFDKSGKNLRDEEIQTDNNQEVDRDKRI